jgi:hypothetical protein
MPTLYKIRVQVIAATDDDGFNAEGTTATQITTKLQTVNEVFATAEVQFMFDEQNDFLKISSTLHNRSFTPLEPFNLPGDKWDHEPSVDSESHERAREELAKQFPGKMVIFFRKRTLLKEEKDQKGNGIWAIVPAGGGASSARSFYVDMRGAGGNDLAHEMGHYLQLPHPFVEGVTTVATAAQKIKDYVEIKNHPRAEGLNALDGDRHWVLDTPADAAGAIFEDEGLEPCGAVGQIPIEVTFSDNTKKTYELAPDRSLVMSYFKGCAGTKTLSPQQARRVRDGLELGLRHNLIGMKPSFSYLIRRGEIESAGAISRLGMALVRAGRVATAVRDDNGDLKIVVWDIESRLDAGPRITRRGSGSAGAVGTISMCSLGLNMLATAVSDGGNTLKVILWRIEEDGSVTRLQSADAEGQIDAVAATHVYWDRMATAVRRSDGTLKVDIWRTTAEGSITHVKTATATAGKIEILGPMSSVGMESFVTYLRDEGDALKPILWRSTKDTTERLGSTTLGEAPVSKVTGCTLSRDVSVAAIRDKEAKLKLIAYGFPENGNYIEERATAGAGSITEVDICRLGTQMVVTGVRDGSNALKVILWQVTRGGNHIIRLEDDSINESFNRLSMCYAGDDRFAIAIEDANGNLKIIACDVRKKLQLTSVDSDQMREQLTSVDSDQMRVRAAMGDDCGA